MKKFNTRTIVLMGLMAAINIILARFLSLQLSDSIRITFGNIPLILTGVLLGPIPAVCVALVGDFVGCVFFSAYSWFPPIALAPMIIGGWSGIFRKQMLRGDFWRVLLVCISGTVIASILYNTYCLSILYGTGFWVLLVARTPVQLLISVVNAAVCHILLKSPIKKVLRPEGIE